MSWHQIRQSAKSFRALDLLVGSCSQEKCSGGGKQAAEQRWRFEPKGVFARCRLDLLPARQKAIHMTVLSSKITQAKDNLTNVEEVALRFGWSDVVRKKKTQKTHGSNKPGLRGDL